MKRPLQINFYTRARCHLCEQAWRQLRELEAEFALELVSIDVDSDPRLAARYGDHVPVAVAGERELFRHRADVGRLRAQLAALGR